MFDDWNSIMHRDFGMNHRNCKNHVYLYQDKVGSLHFHSSDHSVKNESSQQNRGFDEIATDSNNTFFFIGRFLKFCNKLRYAIRANRVHLQPPVHFLHLYPPILLAPTALNH